jgi:outer membrane autotransporter protein
MKKLLIAATIIGSLASSLTNAKTKGNYVGLNIIKTDMQATQNTYNNVSTNNGFKLADEDQISLGIDYKHAFNFGGFFVAPGGFFEYSNVSTKDESGTTYNADYNLNFRLGAKVDLGYDITDKFAAYTNLGLVANGYSYDYKANNGSSLELSDSAVALSYGLGVKYALRDNLDINIEYEVSEFEMDVSGLGNTETQDFDLEIIKVGAAFKF